MEGLIHDIGDAVSLEEKYKDASFEKDLDL